MPKLPAPNTINNDPPPEPDVWWGIPDDDPSLWSSPLVYGRPDLSTLHEEA